MGKLFYSTTEVADLFKVSRVTVYRWIKGGRVSACEIGKHFKIPVDEVQRMARDFGISGGLYLDLLRGGSQAELAASVQLPEVPGEGKKLAVALAGTALKDRVDEIFKSGWLARHCRVLVFSESIAAALAVGRTNPDLLLVAVSDDVMGCLEFAGTVKTFFARIPVVFMVDCSKLSGCGSDHGDSLDALGEVVDVSRGADALRDVISTLLVDFAGGGPEGSL